jgi:hypothetical protein
VPKDSLVSWWGFNGNAYDSSGHNNHGSVFGSTLCNDRLGRLNNAYEFDGISNYIISNGGNQYLNSKFTLSYWIYIKNIMWNGTSITLGSQTSCIWGPRYKRTTTDGLMLDVSIGCGGTSPNHCYPTLDSNKWYNITMAVNDTTVKFYLNSDSIGRAKLNWGSGCSNSNMYFGVDIFSAPEYFKGRLDDIGYWNRNLNQCEITKLYLAMPSLITKHPTNDTLTSLTSATFRITDTMGTSATYQWQENTGSGFVNLSNATPYSGVTTKTLTINIVTSAMNNYQYRCVRNGGSCVDTSDAAKLVINTTGISSLTKDVFTVYPNPTNSTVTVTNNNNITKVEITNVIGQKLLSESYNSNKVTVDISSFEKGVYFIRVNDSYIQKLIKE